MPLRSESVAISIAIDGMMFCLENQTCTDNLGATDNTPNINQGRMSFGRVCFMIESIGRLRGALRHLQFWCPVRSLGQLPYSGRGPFCSQHHDFHDDLYDESCDNTTFFLGVFCHTTNSVLGWKYSLASA